MDNSMQYGMTKLMADYATDGNLTMAEAKSKLQADAYIRTANETLARYCGVADNDLMTLKKRVSGLLSDCDPSQNRDSIERNVRRWVNEKVQFISRENALKLAFALHLSVKDAEEMMWRLCGEGFHWRDPQDIVWLYALGHEMDFADACALSSRMAPAYRLPEDAEDERETMTENIKMQVGQIQSEDELRTFLKEAAPHLGRLHNTAYQLFTDFMELLKTADAKDNLPADRKMPANEIVITYLYNNLIPQGRKLKASKSVDQAEKDAIKRDIQQNWPDEYALSRMANRETDVSRKVLILLFLACDGGETKYGDFSDESREDIFEDTYARLSSMLADCGFPPLDSRIPFDWMILYCMVADDFVDIDENIPRFLSGIFQLPEEPC